MLGLTRDPRRAYAMLVSSLPYPGALFDQAHTPVSRVVLERRLALLSDADRACVSRIERLLDWEAEAGAERDAALLQDAQALLDDLAAAGRADLAGALRHRLEMRVALAALRRRRAGAGPPEVVDGAFAPLARRIAAKWDRADLGLARAHPWIVRAAELIERGDSAALERVVLAEAWRDLTRRAQGHLFDLTAVAVYVLRWRLVSRWTRSESTAAEERFAGLLAASLANLAELPGAEPAHG